jgi:hypothetical protein
MIRPKHVFGALLGLALPVVMLACGGDDSSPVIIASAPPTLALKAIQPVGGPRWEPGGPSCVEVGQDPKQTVAVVADIANFKLRPPGACGSASVCGQAVLRLDPVGETEAVRVSAAAETMELAFDEIPLGTHTFRVELVKQSGANVIDKEAGAPLAVEVTLDVVAPGECEGVIPDGGTDASEDGGSDASEDGGDAGGDASDAGEDVSAGDASDAAEEADAPISDAGGSADADANG